MEVSSSEIALLCRRISSTTGGYTLSSIYSIKGGVLLRLRHETKEERVIAVSSFATWLTSKNFSLEQAEPFVGKIRESLERSRLTSVRTEGNERIATFDFESRSGTKSSLHAEFFGGGNLVLADESEKILAVSRAQRFRHRNLIPGEKYALPPQRGRNLESLDEAFLLSEFSKTTAQGSTEVIRWFGRLVGTSRKFVEEIFFRSGVRPDNPVSSLTTGQVSSLALSSNQLSYEISNSRRGFLLIPLDEMSDIAVDACPILPHAWSALRESGVAEVREFETFNDSLDQAQVESFLFEKRSKASEEIRSKAEELQSAISKQEAAIRSNSEAALKLRSLAAEMMNSTAGKISEAVTKDLESMGVIERDEFREDKLRFSSEPRSYLDPYVAPKALGSRLFSEAKRFEQFNSELAEIRGKLLKRKDDLLEQSRTTEERAERRTTVERRARQWYERYRWFLTSDLRLAVGGRDTTSNSVIVNKYTDRDCIVFHADLHGSPFFVLRSARKDDALKLDQETEQELAQATASFSRAWRDELGSADAYWVEPSQVKKSAPSGEYLPRGSFYIEGKKNFVKHLRIELGVGLVSSRELPHEDGEARGNSEANSSLVVVCGPPKALSKYCVSLVRIAPGRERSSVVARRIKQLLISISKEDQGETRELAKRISVDEIIRSLPSGSYKIVSEKS